MFTFLPARWLAALPALAVCAAGAQTGPAPNATAEAAPLSFRSAMEDYKAFTEEKPIPWKQANETVQQRGGWRAYAREGESPPKSAPTATPPKDKP